MSFTYHPEALDSDPVSYARFVLNDRDAGGPVLQDEEISSVLRLYPQNIRGALTSLAETASLAAAALASEMTNGDRRMAWTDRAHAFAALATRLRTESMPLAWGGGGFSSRAGDMTRPDLDQFKTD